MSYVGFDCDCEPECEDAESHWIKECELALKENLRLKAALNKIAEIAKDPYPGKFSVLIENLCEKALRGE